MLWSKYINLIDSLSLKNPFTLTLAIGRSLLAFAHLGVFIFNDIFDFYSKNILIKLSESDLLNNKINLFVIMGYENLFITKIIAIIICISVITGYLPQITGVLYFWLVYSFQNSAIFLDGGEQIALILSFLLLPLCIFDKRLNHWQKGAGSKICNFIGNIAFMSISVQMSFIYLNTCMEKIYTSTTWRDGTALYYIFDGTYFGLPQIIYDTFESIIKSEFIFFVSWWTLLVHLILAFILILKRKKRLKFFILGFSFHFFIAIFLGLYSFSLVMISGLILYTIPMNYFEKKHKKNKFIKKHEEIRISN